MNTALPSLGSSEKEAESGKYCGICAPAPNITARAASNLVANELPAKSPDRVLKSPVRKARVAAARSEDASWLSPVIE